MAKINTDYFKTLSELEFLLKLYLVKRTKNIDSKNVLIVDNCLIGDFVASIPAIRTYIQENKGINIDLIVSNPVKEIAQKIKGIRNVYIAKTTQEREIEAKDNESKVPGDYSKILVIRINKNSYDLIRSLKFKELKNPLFNYAEFTLNIAKNNFLRKVPIQLRETCSEILGVDNNSLRFEDIFDISESDYSRIRRLNILKTNKKIVLIHTGSTWWANIWDNDKWIKLIRKINKSGDYKFFLVGTQEKEKEDFRYIQSKLNLRIYSLINKVSTFEFLLIERISDYFIGVDSGPRNLAHLADLRSITLLGPGPHNFNPINNKDITLDKSQGKGLYQRFFYKKTGFIHKIEVNEVYNAFKRLIKTSPKSEKYPKKKIKKRYAPSGI